MSIAPQLFPQDPQFGSAVGGKQSAGLPQPHVAPIEHCPGPSQDGPGTVQLFDVVSQVLPSTVVQSVQLSPQLVSLLAVHVLPEQQFCELVQQLPFAVPHCVSFSGHEHAAVWQVVPQQLSPQHVDPQYSVPELQP
jgi:hypothetical protein